MMDNACLFTIISKNYISYARSLIKSFQKYHPGVKTFVLLADKIDGFFDPSQEVFEIIEADNLGIEDFASFSFKYNIVEFNTAVKPFFFELLFSKGYKKVIYMDPDILIFRHMNEVFEALDKHSIVLTPHITAPIPDDGCIPREINILKAGIFNLGFLGLSKSEHSSKLLAWWKDRLYDKCLQSTVSGYAVDQIWLGLVPSFFEDYYVLKNSGYNVAYWNLHERQVSQQNDGFFVNQKPLTFFHFSGFMLNNIERISKYQNRFDLKVRPDLHKLFELYKEILLENGYKNTSSWPYYYGFFKSGTKISDLARGIFYGLNLRSETFGDPFERFWSRLINFRYLRAVFKERFIRTIVDKLFLYAWKVLLKKRGK